MSRWPFREVLIAASLITGPLLSTSANASPDAVAGSQPTTEEHTAGPQWNIKLPPDEPVTFHGVASFDNAGIGSSHVMYPAPNAGGLLAAIVTHGILSSSLQKEQKNAIQTSADEVLLPYRPVLDSFNYRELMQRAVTKTPSEAHARLTSEPVDQSRDILVESSPAFLMTQDQTALILDNSIVIRMPGSPPSGGWRNTIRVVSTPREAENPETFWIGNNGETIKEESARLLAVSLGIAFRNATSGTGTSDVPFQTIRYREGTAEKIERAQVLDNRCGQMLIRNLRGNLMLVPASKPTDAPPEQCMLVSLNTEAVSSQP